MLRALSTAIRSAANGNGRPALEPVTDGLDGDETTMRDLLAACGVEVSGSRPQDIQVHDRRFYRRLLRDGSLGLGESYMDGWWDAEALDECLVRLIRHKSWLERRIKATWRLVLAAATARLVNLQAKWRAFEVGERHYDLGNDLYEAMLDSRLQYTCAYWKDAETLDQAQERKLDLICRKVGLKAGQRVLELGCGWGGFAQFAAERYGVEVVGLTVSKEQVALATERCAGLPVDIRLEDYRNAEGRYDAVVSIGLMEHVGPRNYATYMDVVDRCLVPDGIAFVHTIGGNHSRLHLEPWYHKYIFPNAVIPSLAGIARAMEGHFVLEDLHNIGPHYDKTLMAWHANFEAAWPELKARYGERFRRMWRYYLMSSAAGFRARYTHLWQMVLTRTGSPQPACRLV